MQSLEFGHREWNLAYRVALKIVNTPDEAEDIAQESLLKAYNARHHFAGRSKPETWLHQITRNTAFSHLRTPYRKRYSSQDPGPTLEKTVDPAIHADPFRYTAGLELFRELESCLEQLSSLDQIAFTERFVLGTSEIELSNKMGVTPSAAKQRAFRVRRIVRSHFVANRQRAA